MKDEAVSNSPKDVPRRISDALKVLSPYPSATPDPEFSSDLEGIIRNHAVDGFDPWDT